MNLLTHEALLEADCKAGLVLVEVDGQNPLDPEWLDLWTSIHDVDTECFVLFCFLRLSRLKGITDYGRNTIAR